MNVSLTPKLEALVKQKGSTGLYNSSSEVVREALRLLEEHDRIREMKIEELREMMQEGLGSPDAGTLDIAVIKAEVRKQFQARNPEK